jgi:Fic family protein
LNVLYLINKDLLGLPVLYLSRYIIQHKSDYYKFLREVTEKNNWEAWVKFVLKGIGETAEMTLFKINTILQLKLDTQPLIKKVLKSSYSRELLDLLFSYPYIKTSILVENSIAKRQTAAEYLKKIENTGLITSIKIGKEVYYINTSLMKVLSE